MYVHKFVRINDTNVKKWIRFLESEITIAENNNNNDSALVLQYLISDVAKSAYQKSIFYLSFIEYQGTLLIVVGVEVYNDKTSTRVQGITKLPSAMSDPSLTTVLRQLSMPLHSATAGALIAQYPNIKEYSIDGPLESMSQILKLSKKIYNLTMRQSEFDSVTHILIDEAFLNIWNNMQSIHCNMCGLLARYRCGICYKQAYCSEECHKKSKHNPICRRLVNAHWW